MNNLKEIVLVLLLIFSPLVQALSQTITNKPILYAAFSKDNTLFATVHKEGRLNLWSMRGLTPLYTGEHVWGSNDTSGKMEFNKQGDWILCGDGRSTLFDVKNKRDFDLPYEIKINNYHFSFDGRSLIALKVDEKKSAVYTIPFDSPKMLPAKPDFTLKGATQIREYAPGQFVYSTEGMVNFIRKGDKAPFLVIPAGGFEMGTNGKYVTLSTYDIYDVSSGKPEKAFALKDSDYGKSGKQGKVINDKVYVADQTMCMIYELSTGKLLETISLEGMGRPSSPNAQVFSFDGKFLAWTEAQPIDLKMIDLKTRRHFNLANSLFGAARNYAILKEADSTILLMRKSLLSKNKPNLRLVDKDTAFAFLKDNQAWNELFTQSWYSEAEKTLMEADRKLEESKYEEALDLYSRTSALDATLAGAYEGKAVIYALMKKRDEAEAECKKCLAIDNKNISCNLVLAEVYEFKGLNEKAASCYFTVASNDVTKYKLKLRGIRLMMSVDFNVAKNIMYQYLSEVDNDASAYVLRAEMEKRSGDMQEVGMYYAEAVRVEPIEEYYKLAIDFYLKGENVSTSRRLAEDWLKREPKNPTAQLYLDKVEGKIRSRTEVAADPTDPHTCSVCKGSGDLSLDYNCFSCHGKGRKTCSACGGRRFTYNSSGQSSYCYSCRGEGSSVCGACFGNKPSKTITCTSCHGTGKK